MKMLISLLILLSSFAVQAFTLENNRFYVGTDGHYRTVDMPKEFGGNVFSKHYPGMNVFVGNRLTQHLGIEVGYHSTNNKVSQALINNGEQVLGLQVKDGSQRHISTSSISGYYVHLNTYYPLFEIANNKLEAVGYIGLSNTKIRYKNMLTHASQTSQDINYSVLTFNSTKPLVGAGVGFQYDYCHCAIRLMVNYENLNRFNKVTSSNSSKGYMIKLRDSFHVGLGFVTYLN